MHWGFTDAAVTGRNPIAFVVAVGWSEKEMDNLKNGLNFAPTPKPLDIGEIKLKSTT